MASKQTIPSPPSAKCGALVCGGGELLQGHSEQDKCGAGRQGACSKQARTMQLLLLTAGLGLLWALEEQRPQLVPASSGQLLGKWYIQLWVGTLPIPAQRRSHPLPPFTFVMNQLQKLEFRMNLTKPIGCLPYKMSLSLGNDPGSFYTGWRHRIRITFLPGKQFAIAYFSGTMVQTFHQMMMLMGRTPDKDPEATRTFEEFVESKGLNRSDIARPPQVDACELTQVF